MVRDGFPEDDIISAYEALGSTVDRMETALANGPWLAGEAYTLADVDMIPFIICPFPSTFTKAMDFPFGDQLTFRMEALSGNPLIFISMPPEIF